MAFVGSVVDFYPISDYFLFVGQQSALESVMDEQEIKKSLKDIDQAFKEVDGMYHAYAKFCNMSDSEQWFLYSLWLHDSGCTQKEFCAEWFYSPQTINSALKALEAKGFIRLEFMTGSRKNKNIVFTPEGEAVCRRFIDPLLEAEKAAFCGLDEIEMIEYMRLTKKYNSLLRDEIGKLTKIQTNQW